MSFLRKKNNFKLLGRKPSGQNISHQHSKPGLSKYKLECYKTKAKKYPAYEVTSIQSKEVTPSCIAIQEYLYNTYRKFSLNMKEIY